MVLSREARTRLAWMDSFRWSRNVARTCRHFGISRRTFYSWQHCYDPLDLTTLEGRSHRPIRLRPQEPGPAWLSCRWIGNSNCRPSSPVIPHRLQHSFASEMLRLGVSLPALMQLLGHNDIRMTLRYVQVTQQDLQREFHRARLNTTTPLLSIS